MLPHSGWSAHPDQLDGRREGEMRREGERRREGREKEEEKEREGGGWVEKR